MARRAASFNSYGSGFGERENALFDGGVDVVDGKNLVDGFNFDGFGGHPEDDAGGFVLRDDVAASGLDGFCACGTVVAHASEDRGDAQGAGIGGDALEGDVDIREIVVDAAGFSVE